MMCIDMCMHDVCIVCIVCICMYDVCILCTCMYVYMFHCLLFYKLKQSSERIVGQLSQRNVSRMLLV